MQRLEAIKNKIFNLPSLQKQVAAWKLLSKKIVFTNGCFDILHLGHVEYLANAANLGDILIVAINSDSSVKTLEKGDSRPIQDEYSRLMIMASLHVVNAVVLFSEPTPYEVIKLIKPDVLVKGGDWKVEDIVGHDIVKANGGEVTTISFLPGYSTTNIESKIKTS